MKIKRYPTFEVFRGDGGWFWRLVALNGETQCVSESYVSRRNARRGAKAARRNAWAALIKDIYD